MSTERVWLVGAALLGLLCPAVIFCSSPPSVDEIIQRSVAANQVDFKAAPEFDHKERDRTPSGTKTYEVTMIDGSPYQRLIATNGNPLSAEDAADARKKQQQVENERRSESESTRRERIAKYERGRTRDNQMMQQLTKAFNFTLVSERKVKGFDVWVLKATPRPGYQPPNMQTQVLPGMQGELWIDQQTYQWVKVTAKVIRPVSIDGVLAQVEPGTQFELEKLPVSGDIWQPSHFSMKSQAKVLFMFNHASQDDETYFDYKRSRASTR